MFFLLGCVSILAGLEPHSQRLRPPVGDTVLPGPRAVRSDPALTTTRPTVIVERETAKTPDNKSQVAKISFEDYHQTWSWIATSKAQPNEKNLCKGTW